MSVAITGTPATRAFDSAGESPSVLSVTVPSGATKLVVLVVSRYYETCTAQTYGGVALVSRATQVNGTDLFCISFTQDNPAVGTADVSLSWTTGNRGAMIAFSLSGAATGNFAATAGQNTAAALAVASTSGGLVLSIFGSRDGDSTTIALSAGTSLANLIGSAGAGGNSVRMGAASQAGTGSPVSTTWTPTPGGGTYAHLVVAVSQDVATAATTGTLATGTKTQSVIVSGGQTIILTLTGDTFVAAGATFDAQRQAIINGLDSAQAEATGWDAVVKAGLAVTTVVRTSATVCTITLPAFASYAITADEVITCTIPGAALTLAAPIVSSPTITINEGAVLSAYSGTTNGSGVATTSLTSDQANVRVQVLAYRGATLVGNTTTLPS